MNTNHKSFAGSMLLTGILSVSASITAQGSPQDPRSPQSLALNATMVTTPLSEMSQHQELSSGPETLGQSLGTTHQMGPVVEGTSGRYAVAFSTTDVAATPYKAGYIAGKQLRIERFNWSSIASDPSGDKPPVQLRSHSDRIWEATGLGYDTDDDSPLPGLVLRRQLLPQHAEIDGAVDQVIKV